MSSNSFSEIEHIISWIQFFILFCFIVFDIYVLYDNIYLNRYEMYIKVRVPTLTYIYVSCGIFMILGRMFLEPHNCPFEYCQLKDDDTYTQQDPIQFLNSVAFTIRVTFLGAGYLMKLWYLHYALKLQTLFLNGKWWIKINQNLDQNWWIKNANKYGKANKRMWFILVISMASCIGFAVFAGLLFDPLIPKMVSFVIFLNIIVFTVAFYCKIPPINDIYGIKTEIKIASVTLAGAFLWFPIAEYATS